MRERSSHAVCRIHVHLVWRTADRRPLLAGPAALACRNLIRRLCESQGAGIAGGAVAKDHVRLLVDIPPTLAIGPFAEQLKDAASAGLLRDFPGLRKACPEGSLWQPGFFCAGEGRVTDRDIRDYIEAKGREEGAPGTAGKVFR